MWDRFVDVFAMYGVIAALVVGDTIRRNKGVFDEKSDALTMLVAWGAMNFGLGLPYVLLAD